MRNSSNKILILADNRPGTYSQAIALAKELGEEFKILNISYSKLIKIPNFFFPSALFRYDSKTKKKLKNFTNFPQIIISPGRRSVSAALYLKKKSENTSKIIQIMNPNINPHKLDLVILPIHDKHKKHSKIINSFGAISALDHYKIDKDKEIFSDFFTNINKKISVLLVGGPSKKTSFNKDAAIELAKASSKIANDNGAKLFILTSPRTTSEIIEGLKIGLSGEHHIFDYNNVRDANPYHACLGYGDFFIVSGDSVSMISECCALTKPVLIFDREKLSSKKHKAFHQYLYNNNYAKVLDNDLDINNISTPNILNEAKRISVLIKERFL